MLGNFYLEPHAQTQEFYVVTIPGHIINTDSVWICLFTEVNLAPLHA